MMILLFIFKGIGFVINMGLSSAPNHIPDEKRYLSVYTRADPCRAETIVNIIKQWNYLMG